ncbi:hypothetical protein M8C21_009116 [Ambrosia artemisiifolia]|uniref:Uncharacterized protein n=1 Tax=Ambrosia artemisiifolia TaxID=4212 RepID=A0AAD5CWS7_AMBAR|nr:hypothetical protein M8C21_009116 [Ambrosia artemisiifolia]
MNLKMSVNDTSLPIRVLICLPLSLLFISKLSNQVFSLSRLSLNYLWVCDDCDRTRATN